MLNQYNSNDYTYYPNIRIIMPDLYESDLTINETAEFYRHKIIEWLKNGDFDDVLDLLIVDDKKIKPGKDTTTDENRKNKIRYIKNKFLTESSMIAIINNVKSKTRLSANEFVINRKLVKRAIRKLFINKLKKYID